MAQTSTFLGALAGLLLLAACEKDPIPATQLLVTVDSDLEVGRQITAVRIEIRNSQGERTTSPHTFALATGRPTGQQVELPFSFGIEKKNDERFQLITSGMNDEDEVVEYRVNARFQEEKTLGLSVFLATVCIDKDCGSEQTCYGRPRSGTAAGECGEIRGDTLDPVDPDDLPDAGSRDAGGEPEAGRGGAGSGGRAGGAGRAGAGSGAGAGGTRAGSGGAGSGGAGSGGAGSGGAGAGGAGSGGAPATCNNCLAGETCVSGRCQCATTVATFYRDADLDTFGDPAMSRMFCGAPPAGWVSSKTDCCDSDDQAFPGQEDGSEQPTNCPAIGYDYNCNGQVEMALPVVAAGYCCDQVPAEPEVGPEIAACGETAQFIACNDACEVEMGPLTQWCR
jgi:ribosomal protein S27E